MSKVQVCCSRYGYRRVRQPLPRKNLAAHFLRDETGATAIEYGLIGALMTIACLAGMTLVGTQLRGLYNAVSAAITPAL
jgi:pilus assembly protein Flp/PilA